MVDWADVKASGLACNLIYKDRAADIAKALREARAEGMREAAKELADAKEQTANLLRLVETLKSGTEAKDEPGN